MTCANAKSNLVLPILLILSSPSAFALSDLNETGCHGSLHNPLIQKIEYVQSQPSHLGFFPVNSPVVPPAIKEAAKSVYQIVTAAGEKGTLQSIFGPGRTIKQMIEQVNARKLDKQAEILVVDQIRACASQPDLGMCQIFTGDKVSSGYLTKNGSTIHTAFHAVQDLVQDKIDKSPSQTASADIPIYIYDSSGKLVWSPSVGHAKAKYLKFTQAHADENPDSFLAPNLDNVEIQLSKIIGKPLAQSTESPKPGDVIMQIGYPTKTTDRAAFNAPDSLGNQVSVSFGHVLDQDQVAQKLGVQSGGLTADSKTFLNGLIATDADGAPGLSGGVTVNKDGQITGTYTAGSPADGRATPNHVSYTSNNLLMLNP